ncbi:unnamed protein product, partial [Rotaria magnacalcarata]
VDLVLPVITAILYFARFIVCNVNATRSAGGLDGFFTKATSP